MNYTNFKILNINFTYILDYMTTLFSDIRLDVDILLTIFLIINTLLAFSIVFLEYQTTRSSWAWILVLFLIPYLGFILYLMLGRPIYREKIFPFSDEEKISYQESLLKQATPYEISKEEQIIYKYRNLIELNYETDKAFLSKKNKIKIITDGKEKFELLFEDIKKAKNYIHIQYYILNKDGIGKQLFNLLEQKLKEGVKVYILYDDIGSRKLSISSLRKLTKNNAKIKSFFKSKLPLINFRMNYTNFNILNINFTYILDYMTTLFSDIRLDIDILLTIFLIINTLLAFSIVFLEYQTTHSSWAWILVLFLIPYLGFILYLMLGRPIYREKIFPFTDEEKISYQESLLKRTIPYEISKEEQIIYKYRNLIELNYETDKAFLSKKNKIKIITDGKEKFELLFEDIKKAKDYIYIQYYILKKDGIGKQLFNLLEQKLKEGVKVYILYDDIGSRKLSISSLGKLTKNNAKIKSFFKSKLPLINFRMNYRNHRKIVVIDGEIAYTGGFNVGDEYLGLDKKFGYWRDTHLRIEGEAVVSLEFRFIDDWNSQSSKKTEQIKLEEDHAAIPIDNYLPIQMVASGPDSKLEKIKYGYLHMISRAKKYIYIQSPYFIPDESVMDALKMAILSGIDVRIMVPNKPDHMFVYWATYSFIGELASLGAKTYIYENGFIHTKMIIIDDEVTSLGSANFDYRSFKLNFELNAFMYDYKTTKAFRKIFLEDVKKSTLVSYSKYQQRSLIIRIKEAFARLISPIL